MREQETFSIKLQWERKCSKDCKCLENDIMFNLKDLYNDIYFFSVKL